MHTISRWNYSEHVKAFSRPWIKTARAKSTYFEQMQVNGKILYSSNCRWQFRSHAPSGKYQQPSGMQIQKKNTGAQPVMNEQSPQASWEGKGDESIFSCHTEKTLQQLRLWQTPSRYLLTRSLSRLSPHIKRFISYKKKKEFTHGWKTPLHVSSVDLALISRFPYF